MRSLSRQQTDSSISRQHDHISTVFLGNKTTSKHQKASCLRSLIYNSGVKVMLAYWFLKV